MRTNEHQKVFNSGSCGGCAVTYGMHKQRQIADMSENLSINTNGFEVKEIDSGVEITGYTGQGGDVSIPSTIRGNKVIRISDNAFENCTNLTSVTIPDSVTKIDDSAFVVCTKLTSAAYKGKTYDYGHIEDLYNAINGN